MAFVFSTSLFEAKAFAQKSGTITELVGSVVVCGFEQYPANALASLNKQIASFGDSISVSQPTVSTAFGDYTRMLTTICVTITKR